jgi:hypothetical protein
VAEEVAMVVRLAVRVGMGLLLVAALAGCGDSESAGGGDGGHGCAGCDAPPACSPEGQAVAGIGLSFASVVIDSFASECQGGRLLRSGADVAAAFPGGDAPEEVAGADFAVDRVVLALSNPALRFAVDDGVDLVIGEELLCQGAAPSCMAFVVHGTTRDTLRLVSCPYLGPDPCLAP